MGDKKIEQNLGSLDDVASDREVKKKVIAVFLKLYHEGVEKVIQAEKK